MKICVVLEGYSLSCLMGECAETKQENKMESTYNLELPHEHSEDYFDVDDQISSSVTSLTELQEMFRYMVPITIAREYL